MVYHTELTTSKVLPFKGGLEGRGLTVNHIKPTTTYTFYIKARSVIFSKKIVSLCYILLHLLVIIANNKKKQQSFGEHRTKIHLTNIEY